MKCATLHSIYTQLCTFLCPINLVCHRWTSSEHISTKLNLTGHTWTLYCQWTLAKVRFMCIVVAISSPRPDGTANVIMGISYFRQSRGWHGCVKRDLMRLYRSWFRFEPLQRTRENHKQKPQWKLVGWDLCWFESHTFHISHISTACVVSIMCVCFMCWLLYNMLCILYECNLEYTVCAHGRHLLEMSIVCGVHSFAYVNVYVCVHPLFLFSPNVITSRHTLWWSGLAPGQGSKSPLLSFFPL